MTAVSTTPGTKGLAPDIAKAGGRWALTIGSAVGLFALLMLTKGVNPLDAYGSMWSAITGATSLTAIVKQGTPIVLAALAVTIPAKAGLVNVGGEGQLVMGGVFAAGTGLGLEGHLPGQLILVLMCVMGALGGALWAGLAAVLKLAVGINESVTTLLLNYIAINLLAFLIFEPWKDRNGSGQPATRPLPVSERFSLIGSSKINTSMVLAVVAVPLVWWLIRSTRLGFQLRVVGGNPEAARRAGLRVGALIVGAMLLGGALAGLGGVAWYAGSEFKLRQGFLVSYGYIAFLASWLARHDPPKVLVSAVLLAAISISGDSLQIDSQLPAATVNILMALVLLAVFGFGARTGAGQGLLANLRMSREAKELA